MLLVVLGEVSASNALNYKATETLEITNVFEEYTK